MKTLAHLNSPASCLLASVVFFSTLSACKTSSEIAKNRSGHAADPSGVVTVESLGIPTTAPHVSPQTSTAVAPPSTPTITSSTSQFSPNDMSPEQELAYLRGKIEDLTMQKNLEKEELNKKILELEEKNLTLNEELIRRQNAPTPGLATNSATGAVLLWQTASQSAKAGQYETASVPLTEIVKNYPKHELAMPALVNLGVIQYELNMFSDAAITFNQVIEKYPKHREVALAWFGQAASFSRLKQPAESKLVYEELIKRFPRSEEAKSARVIVQKKSPSPNSLMNLASKHPSLRL